MTRPIKDCPTCGGTLYHCWVVCRKGGAYQPSNSEICPTMWNSCRECGLRTRSQRCMACAARARRKPAGQRAPSRRRNERSADIRVCAHCEKEFHPWVTSVITEGRTGRPPRFCSAECRVESQRATKVSAKKASEARMRVQAKAFRKLEQNLAEVSSFIWSVIEGNPLPVPEWLGSYGEGLDSPL